VTSGSKRYLIPDDCEKGRPNFKRNRQVWSRREADVLKGRGFKPVRMFIREDGMVIDWESSVPVWSDTLQPVGTDLASVIQRAHAANDQPNNHLREDAWPNYRSRKPKSMEMSPPIRKQFPPPPRVSPSAARITDAPVLGVSLPSPTSSNRSTHYAEDGGRHNRPMICDLVSDPEMISAETSPTSRPGDMTADTKSIAINKADELQAAALRFLEQYIKIFDEDRADLASAYSRNAVFSCRVHELDPTSSSRSKAFAPKLSCRDTPGPSNIPSIKQNRLEIITALHSLDSSHKFCAQGDANITYDFAYLDPTHDIILICYAEIVDTRQGHKLSLDQSFVLRRKEDDEDRLSEGLWPLVAVSHQMTIRDLSQRSKSLNAHPS